MTVMSLGRHIEVTPGVAGGKPRIAGHRITVQDVVNWYERQGKTAGEIAAEFGITLSDVHAALAYFHDHRDEIDKSVRDSAQVAATVKARIPSKVAARLQEAQQRAEP